MKRLSVLLLAVFFFSPVSALYSQEKPTPCPSWSVHFSPNGGCTQAIVQELDKAKVSILVQAYNFSHAEIAKALLKAQKRGVRVEVILDKGQRKIKYSSAKFFLNQGIPTKIDAAHGKNHNKIIIIDGETVITGSFNFTRAAEEKNAENLLIIRDKALAGKYVQNWEEHAKHSENYERKAR